MGGELKQIKDHLKVVDELILIIKATGGWKYRKDIQLTDLQFSRRMEVAEKELRNLAINLAVSETMLQEPPPSLHPRWEEYESRRKEILKELEKK